MEYKTVNAQVTKIFFATRFLPKEQAQQVENDAVVLVTASDFLAKVAMQCGINSVRRVLSFYETSLGYYPHVAVETHDSGEVDCKNLLIRFVRPLSDGSVTGVQLEFIWNHTAGQYCAVESKVTTVQGFLARTVVDKDFITKNL